MREFRGPGVVATTWFNIVTYRSPSKWDWRKRSYVESGEEVSNDLRIHEAVGHAFAYSQGELGHITTGWLAGGFLKHIVGTDTKYRDLPIRFASERAIGWDLSGPEYKADMWEDYVWGKEKKHPFSSSSAFSASLLTGFISLLNLAYGAYFYVMRPDLTVMALAALSVRLYLSFSTEKYFTRGMAAYDALKKWNRTLAQERRLSDKELRETPIAEATLKEIKFHPAFKHIKENKIKEDIRQHEYIEQKALKFLNRHLLLKPLINTQLPHYIAMLAMLPVMDMFIHGKGKTAAPISEKSHIRIKHPLQISPPSKSKELERSV